MDVLTAAELVAPGGLGSYLTFEVDFVICVSGSEESEPMESKTFDFKPRNRWNLTFARSLAPAGSKSSSSSGNVPFAVDVS